MDGEHTSSAGRVGFEVPTTTDRVEAYEKLIQVSWREEMAEVGNSGLHVTSGASGFIATYVAPFVLTERWNEDLRRRIEQQRWTKAPTSVPATGPASQPASGPATRPRGKEIPGNRPPP